MNFGRLYDVQIFSGDRRPLVTFENEANADPPLNKCYFWVKNEILLTFLTKNNRYPFVEIYNDNNRQQK